MSSIVLESTIEELNYYCDDYYYYCYDGGGDGGGVVVVAEMPSLPDSQGGSLKLCDFCVNRCTNFNASLIFGLATPIELYTFDRNLPDSQTNPPSKNIEMVGISVVVFVVDLFTTMHEILSQAGLYGECLLYQNRTVCLQWD